MLTGKREALFTAADFSRQADCSRAYIVLITPDDDQLRILEQVAERARVDPIGFDAAKIQLQIRQHRVVDAREEVRDFDFEVFLRLDVIADAAIVRRQLIEQVGVHIVADAEGKQPHARAIGALRVADNLFHIGRADGR